MDQVAYMVSRVEGESAQCLRVGSPTVDAGRTVPVRVLLADGEALDAELESLGEEGGVLHGAALDRVATGDLVVYAAAFEEAGDGRVTSPSLDDRIGCLLTLHAARALAGERLPVAFAWTTREESEQAGVLRVARDIDPEVLVAVDITYATTPGQVRESPVVVGEGPAVTLLDGGMVGHPPLIAAVDRAARELGIHWQREVVSLGTSEAGRVQRTTGIPAVALLVPIENPHSPDETADMRDVEQAIALLEATIRALV
jgi:endoglucanase